MTCNWCPDPANPDVKHHPHQPYPAPRPDSPLDRLTDVLERIGLVLEEIRDRFPAGLPPAGKDLTPPPRQEMIFGYVLGQDLAPTLIQYELARDYLKDTAPPADLGRRIMVAAAVTLCEEIIRRWENGERSPL